MRASLAAMYRSKKFTQTIARTMARPARKTAATFANHVMSGALRRIPWPRQEVHRRQSDFAGEVALREVARHDLAQLGFRRLADFLRVRAARMKRASARQVDRARELSPDPRSAALELRIRHRHRG